MITVPTNRAPRATNTQPIKANIYMLFSDSCCKGTKNYSFSQIIFTFTTFKIVTSLGCFVFFHYLCAKLVIHNIYKTNYAI